MVIAHGSFGTVFEIEHLSKNYAVKGIDLPNK
jgi:hypothetical protein